MYSCVEQQRDLILVEGMLTDSYTHRIVLSALVLLAFQTLETDLSDIMLNTAAIHLGDKVSSIAISKVSFQKYTISQFFALRLIGFYLALQ